MQIRNILKNKLLKAVALSVLGLTGLAALPATAQAAVTCSSVTLSGGVYPSGHLYYCGSTPPNGNTAASALYGLGADAKSRLNNNNHTFYIFANVADYTTYRTQANATPTPPAISIPATFAAITDNSGPVFNTLIFEDRLTTNHLYIDNVTAHEAGHHLDYIYGHLRYTRDPSFPANINSNDWFSAELNKDFYYRLLGFKATIGGQSEAGDVETIQFSGAATGAGNPPAPISISYTVQAGDSLAIIAQNLVNRINANATLTGSVIKGKATLDPGTPTFRFYSSSPLAYTINGTYTNPASHVVPSLRGYDFATFAARSPQCKNTGAVFTGAYDTSAPTGVGQPICGSLQNVKIGGSPAATDVYRIVVTDANIPGSPINVNFTETSPASQTSVVDGLTAAICYEQRNSAFSEQLNSADEKNLTAGL